MKKSNVKGTATKMLLARRNVFPGLSSWSFDNARVMRVESGNDTMKPPNTGVLLATHSAVEMINADNPMLRPSCHMFSFYHGNRFLALHQNLYGPRCSCGVTVTSGGGALD